MKNEKLWRRFQRVLKTLPTTFHYFQTSCFTITLCYFFNPPQSRQPHHRRHPALSITSHYPNFKFAPSAQPQFFILHFSFFILPHHRHSSLSLAPHYQKSKFAPSAQPQFFIFHFSFFILHFSKHHPLPSLRPSYQLLSLTF